MSYCVGHCVPCWRCALRACVQARCVQARCVQANCVQASVHTLLHYLFNPLPLAERTVALLAFDDVQASPLAELMDVAQRQKTASELNAAILSSQGQEQEPRLPMLLKTMLWCQGQLQQRVNFPTITDLATGALDDPAAD